MSKNSVVRLFCLPLILAMSALIVGGSVADNDPASIRMSQESPSMCDKLDAYDLGNLCLESTIRDNSNADFSSNYGSELTAVIDGDPYTFVSKNCASDQWIEIRFQGARKWVNRLEIEYTGSGDFRFEVFDFHGDLRPIDILSIELSEGHASDHIKSVEFEPVTAKGIRWSFTSSDFPDEKLDIHEISVWFNQSDPDRQPPDPDQNDSTKWLLCETGDPWIGPPDIRPLWNRINALPDWCPQAWHWCHLWLPPADWAGDFKRAAVGGGENSHAMAYTGMDYHDLSVIACHGSPCRIQFSTGPFPATNVLTPPGDIWHSWGDRDAEWFCALSCSAYGWDPATGGPWCWAHGFNGLHLQCGFTTIAWATNGRFLGGFAWLMIGQWWKPAIRITPSWFIARAAWQGPGTCVLVMADNWINYFDHLWGQGWVGPDPAPPRGIVWAIWDPPFSEKESHDRAFPPALTEEQVASIASISSGSSTLTLPARSPMGMPVKVKDDLYNTKAADPMTIYHLEPSVQVTESRIQELADDMCVNYGILCVPEVGQDDDGNWWATEDEYAIWGSPENGVVQFANLDEYVAKEDVAPTIPDPTTATSMAMNMLTDLGLYPSGDLQLTHSYNVQTAYDLDAEEIIADSSFDLSINAEFGRGVDGYAVFGPGGYIAVTFGDYGEVQHFTRGGWHDLIDPSTEDVLEVSEAIDLLSTQGENATIGGIPPIADILLIDSVETAYYNTNGEYETDILEPIYHFSCYAISEFDSLECDVYVPIRASMLRGYIDDPVHGSTFEMGKPITFVGSATGGIPEYEFEWYSDTAGYLGSGSNLMVDWLTPVYKDTFLIAHRITMTVSDQEASSRSVSISVYIEEPGYVCGDANGSGTVDIDDVVYLIQYIFAGGPAPDPLASGDVDCSGGIDIDDVVYLINYIFVGGYAPCDPDGDEVPDC